MQWARRQHQTRRQSKSLKTTLVAVLVSIGLATSILLPFASQTASAAPLTSATTFVPTNVTIMADNTSSADACNFEGNSPLTWIICPIVDAVSTATKGMQNLIDHMMMVDVTGTFCRDNTGKCTASDAKSGSAYYAAWNSFRIFGIAFIVIAGLIMVISQALGFEMFDAYTVKKVLPRMLVAIIGISLSWWLMKFLAELTNDLGIGIRSIIYYPFKSLLVDGTGYQSWGSLLIESLIGAGAIVFLGIAGIFSLLLTAALAVFVAFLVLIVRQIVITFLILLAPIAIALYVLPNTEKVYKMWWDSLFKGLMMFPIITGFIATGQVFSVVAGGNTNQNFGFSKVIAILAYFLPYFAIPFTFRLAGGAIATLGGLANDRSRGVFDRLKQYRSNKVGENIQGMKTGNRYRGNTGLARAFNRTTRGASVLASGEAGINPTKWKSRVSGAISRNTLDEAREAAEKSREFGAIRANDDYLTAALLSRGNEADAAKRLRGITDTNGNRIYDDRTVNEAVAQMRAARRSMSNDTFDTAAALSLPATGTAFRGGAGEMHNLINQVAGNDRNRAATMLAAMRSGAESARRFDLAGGSYGSQMGVLEAQFRGTMDTAAANDRITRESLEARGGSYIAGARNGAVKNYAPLITKDVRDAMTSGNDQEAIRQLASVAGRYDAMASVAPENAQVLAEEVMGKEIDVSQLSDAMRQKLRSAIAIMDNNGNIVGSSRTISIQKAVEAMRSDDQFLTLRREYGQASITGARAAQEEAIRAQYSGYQGPQGPPQGGPQGPVMG